MNGGHVLGIVREFGRPLEGALIGLDWVQAGGQYLPLYPADADGAMDRLRSVSRGISTEMPARAVNLNTTTNDQGAFILSFQWSGTDLGIAMDAPRCSIFLIVEQRSQDRVTMRFRGRFRIPMIRAVSLSQVSSGLIANPSQGSDQVGLGVDFHTVIRSIRRPMIGLTVTAPSPDMYALVAGIRISL